MVDELFERFVSAEVAEVVEDFVPEAGVEQVEDGVLGAADVEVDVGVVARPVVFCFFGYEGLFVGGVAVAKVIPTGASPLGHGVGFAFELIGVVDPIGRAEKGATGVASGLEVFHLGLEKGQLVFGNGRVFASFLVPKKGEGFAPVALTRDCLLYTSPSPRDS